MARESPVWAGQCSWLARAPGSFTQRYEQEKKRAGVLSAPDAGSLHWMLSIIRLTIPFFTNGWVPPVFPLCRVLKPQGAESALVSLFRLEDEHTKASSLQST